MSARRRPILFGGIAVACAIAAPKDARAVDLPKVDGTPVKVDVTETAIAAQRFEAREGEREEDQGWFVFLNRFNATFGWRKWTLGLRIDSSVYALRPEDRNFSDPQLKRSALIDGSTRFRDRFVYPAKLWLTYKSETVEATAGDSYVQFGRGLVLSLRKVDELGIDTTLFGGKVTLQKDPFAATLIAGFANPTRIDEPTGRALFVSRRVPRDGNIQAIEPSPMFGSDGIVGAQVMAGRGLPVTASTQAVRITKCAPYTYEGNVVDAPIDGPGGFVDGGCEATRTDEWLNTLPGNISPTLRSKETINASETLEVPSLWGHGNLYVEAAVQKRQGDRPTDANTEGNAIYGSLVTSGGPLTNTLEVKSYRNFYPVAAGVNVSKASAFANIAYSAPPTTEPITSDVMFGFYNVCVTGGRDRLDYNVSKDVQVHGAYGYAVTRSEVPGASCDRLGRSTADKPDDSTNYVSDAEAGVQWSFDGGKSIVFADIDGRHDIKETGFAYYRELSADYSVTKFIKGTWSVELSGRHRYRIQENENRRESFRGDPWWQGEHYNTVKFAPKWVFSQGFEYTTLIGLPTYYLNGSVLYKFTPQSNVRVLAGQNRGGLRCVSGICRFFPAFSGVRVELTLRF